MTSRPRHLSFHSISAVEFTTELCGGSALIIPIEIAAKLPKSGTARIIVLTVDDSHVDDWRAGAYAQFLRDDPEEDAIYETCR